MKKTFTYLSLLVFLAIASTSTAQISQGGKPKSFTQRDLSAEIPVRKMPFVDVEFLKQEDALNNDKAKPYRFGANIEVDINLQNAGLWETLPNGDKLWRLAIRSQDALSLNFIFNDFYLPQGAKFYIYNPEHSQVLGAFTSFNNRADRQFGTDLISGDIAVLEYLEPKENLGQGQIGLKEVIHGYRDIAGYFNAKNSQASGACNVNVNCPAGDDWQVEKRSVCIIIVNGSGSCTGAMINDVPQSGTPYFLTANHCTQGDNVGNWVFRFNYESVACNGTTGPTSQSISGATLRARNGGSDFALLELSSAPPVEFQAVFAGWNREGVVVDSAVGIHHPAGDIKKISKAQNPTISGTYSNADCWRVGQWTLGVTEGGSSGSPLFDPNHRIIGQLFGGPSACGQTPGNLNDFYGKFSTSWDDGNTPATRLVEWLDPQGVNPLTVDAYDPTNISYVTDGAIRAITVPVDGFSSCNDQINPIFTIKNFGTDTIDSVSVELKVNGIAIDTFEFSTFLITGDQTNLVINNTVNLSPGDNIVSLTLISVNGVTDENSNNNSKTSTITYVVPVSVATPIQNGFQPSSFPSAGFSIENDDSDLTWERTGLAGGFGQSSACAKIRFFDYNTLGTRDYLVLPYANFIGLLNPLRLTFDVAYARYDNTNNDTLVVAVSTDCGITWTEVYNKGNLQLATNGGAGVAGRFIPTATQWRTDSVNMNSYSGQNDVLIRFEARNGYGNDMYLDNINLSDIPNNISDINVEMITLFPIPVKDKLNIQIRSNYQSLKVLNSLGQKVSVQVLKVSNSETVLNTNELTPGMYFLEIQKGDSFNRIKFVKE